VHSYKTVPEDLKLVVATSDYGVSIPAMIERNNLIGVQFHPEKSGDVGALMIKNFIKLCKKEAK
jgi:glutamine amidotransferase